MEYKLNISEQEFKSIYSGEKKFMVLKNYNHIKIGDLLIIHESINEKTSANVLHRIVSYIDKDSAYLKDGYVIVNITESSKLYT